MQLTTQVYKVQGAIIFQLNKLNFIVIFLLLQDTEMIILS